MIERIFPFLERLFRVKHVSTPTEYVDAFLSRPMVWTDWRGMDLESRREWAKDAKNLLENRVFRSFCGYRDRSGIKTNGEMSKDIIEHLARHAKDYQEVIALRMTMNGIELVRDRVEESLLPEDRPSSDGIYDPI